MYTLDLSRSLHNPQFQYVYQTTMMVASVSDDDGNPFNAGTTFEWIVDDRVVRTERNFISLGQQDVGHTVTVRALVPQADGSTVTVTTDTAYLVREVNDGPRGYLAIHPDAAERVAGSVLTLEGSIDDPEGMGALSYQWLADGQPIAGATGANYALTEADIGKDIVAAVSYVDGLGILTTYRTDGARPDNTKGAIALEDSYEPGHVLHAAIVDPDGPAVIHYAWEVADDDGTWHTVAGAAGPDLHVGEGTPAVVRVLADYADNGGTVETPILTVGTGGGDDIRMSYVGEKVLAGAGDDTIHFTLGAHTIDGGAGLDTFTTDGNWYVARQDTADPGIWYVTDSLLRGIFTLVDVERAELGDGRFIALDTDGAAGQAYRLYQAAFDRTPDQARLGFWISQLDQGASLDEVAAAFVASGEFRTLYGADPSNAEIVAGMYRHVLHREPDADGTRYWIDALDGGTAGAADVLAGFSASAENVAALVGAMSYGIAYQPWA